jgi:hypothetical protein
LPFELEDTAVHVGLIRQNTGIIDQVARRKLSQPSTMMS